MYDDDDFEFDNVFMESVVQELDRQETQFLQSQDPNGREALTDLTTSRSEARIPDREPFVTIDSPGDDIAALSERQVPSGACNMVFSNENQAHSTELHTLVERLQLQISQDQEEKKSALKELERYRAELQFKTQELESTKLALNMLKAKQAQSNANSKSNITSQATVSSRKKSFFPSSASFSKPVSRIPSRRENTMEVESPVPEVHSEPKLETVQGSASATKKRKRESSHSEPTAPSKQVKINDNDDENVKKDKEVLYSSIDYRTKLLWSMLAFDYNESQIQNHGVVKDLTYTWSQDRTATIYNFLAERLLLDNTANKTPNSRLVPLVSNIETILTRNEKLFDLENTVEKLIQLLGIYIDISTSEQKVSNVFDALQILSTLSDTYQEANEFMLYDLILGGELSVLGKLANCLEIFKQLKRRNHTEEQMEASQAREVSSKSFRDMLVFCKKHKISAKDALQISEESDQSQVDLVLFILNIYINVIRNADMESTERFQFILQRKSFIKLLSEQAPFSIISKALDIMILLVEGPIRSYFCGVKNAKVDDSSAFHNVVALLSLPLPNARLEDEWYNVRIKALTLMETILQFGYPDGVLQESFKEVALLLVALMNKECIAMSKRSNEISRQVPRKKSFEFLVHGADLMCGILNTYPSVYQTHCKKESFMHRVVRIFRVARENFGIHHGTVTKLGKLVTSLQSMSSAHSSDGAKTQM
ncbi:hypothetical protein VTP01DRAFT_7395 [Rhizomucor pusillus]|uniref:uncharacterized protein n=1 Tax=Rhizomucor pusillus TaxID=4840 RepID=UPI00374464FB